MHRVRYLLLAYTYDLANDNLSDARKHQMLLHHKLRDLRLPPIVSYSSHGLYKLTGGNYAIKLFWKTSAILPSFKREIWFSPWIRQEERIISAAAYINSRARLNVSQYKHNRRATCVHFLHNISIRFIRKTTLKKIHFYVQLRIMALRYSI